MGMMINFSEDKIENLSENIEQGLRYIGKAMQCIDEMRQQQGGGMMGQRDYNREYHPYRMGMRDRMDDEMKRDPMNERMGERRGYRDPMYY